MIEAKNSSKSQESGANAKFTMKAEAMNVVRNTRNSILFEVNLILLLSLMHQVFARYLSIVEFFYRRRPIRSARDVRLKDEKAVEEVMDSMIHVRLSSIWREGKLLRLSKSQWFGVYYPCGISRVIWHE